MKRPCLYCNKWYQAKVQELNRGKREKNLKGQFCSIKCGSMYYGTQRIKENNCKCPICHDMFYRSPSKLKKSKSKKYVCSRKCQNIAQTLALGLLPNSRYKDGICTYKDKAFKYYGAMCAVCGLTERSILLVHHKDGDRKNNSIKNLEVLCFNDHGRRHTHKGILNYSKVPNRGYS